MFIYHFLYMFSAGCPEIYFISRNILRVCLVLLKKQEGHKKKKKVRAYDGIFQDSTSRTKGSLVYSFLKPEYFLIK